MAPTALSQSPIVSLRLHRQAENLPHSSSQVTQG